MIIKKISLENIRSYENQEIEFPKGSTLLSGDIGAGKTSILLGIEFALFGIQPGKKGTALLKNGKTEGVVKLEFEVDGKEFIVERKLKRGKTVSQDYCAITSEGEKKELSVTELKEKILDILNYPKEFSRKQNLLYKFTVYTPQEEMKQIILEDSETRINTLRHVFGVDKYKKILENSSILISNIREEKKIAEGMTSNLEQDKLSLISKEEENKIKKEDLVSLEKEILIAKEKRKSLEQEIGEVSKKKDEKIKFQQEVEKTKIMISNKKDSVSDNKKTINFLNTQISEAGEIEINEEELQSLKEFIEKVKQQEKELDELRLKISSEINSLKLRIDDREEIKRKISKLDICPTCLQDVDSVYKSNVFNKMDSEISDSTNNIEKMSLEMQTLTKKIEAIDFEISKTQEKIHSMNILKIKQEGLKEKETRIKELEKINISLDKDITLLEQHIGVLKKSVFELSRFDSIFQEKEKKLKEAWSIERDFEIKIAEIKKEIYLFSKQIEEISEKIKKTEEIKNRLNYLSNLESWLSNKFLSIISFIEKNVMMKLKSEFSKLFSEWFSMLVSEVFEVRLQDDFTPIIEQQDYELDYEYLSGGERTAVALAYRLALNQIINSILSKIKTKEIVILDEPTDGFSAPQLDKMRDVLQELDVKQLIIVSHEQKMEGFVENVIRLKKENGFSRAKGIS
jgi:DNA repair protein SbcC/Rad50